MLIQQSNKHQLKDDVDEVFCSDFDFPYAVDDIHSVGTIVIAPILRLSTSRVHRQLDFTLSIILQSHSLYFNVDTVLT